MSEPEAKEEPEGAEKAPEEGSGDEVKAGETEGATVADQTDLTAVPGEEVEKSQEVDVGGADQQPNDVTEGGQGGEGGEQEGQDVEQTADNAEVDKDGEDQKSNEKGDTSQNGDQQQANEALIENEENNNKNVEDIENQKNLEKSGMEESAVINVEITEKPKSASGSRGMEGQHPQQPQVENMNGVNKENSFMREIKKEAKVVSEKINPTAAAQKAQGRSKKKIKKGIFISYSPDAGFIERKFVVELVNQLKENNLAEDIWFDKDEGITDSPVWFSQRMEAVERCRAAILVLSDSFFLCPVSCYEGKALLERQMMDNNSCRIYLVLYSNLEETEIPRQYSHLLGNIVDLTGPHSKKSLAEKTSVVVGSLMEDLERYASINAPPVAVVAPDAEFTGEYKKKKICQWSASDLQEWLFTLGIKEFYRQSFAENLVDGFLLMSMTDQDMIQQLGTDSRVVRKKIMQQILVTLDKEHKLSDNWHLRARTQRSRPNTVYLVYDPADVRLAQNLKQDLLKKNMQVIHHQKLGQSKEEFLQLNGPHLAQATYALIIMTDAATNSPFVFHEVLFADWLGKKLVVSMFRNTWFSLRPALRAVLGEVPAVDFETKMYPESMDVLEHHMKPIRSVPGVVLEQSYLNKMADGLKPFGILATMNGTVEPMVRNDEEPKVFISFQWDMQSRVEDIRRILEANDFPCWVDISPTLTQRGNSGVSNRGVHGTDSGETLQSQIQRNMKAASVVLCCITPKYMQSDNCVKDLTLAETLHKTVIPVMLRFCPWPPEGAPPQVRKILVRLSPIDLSNERLFKQNVRIVVDRVSKSIK
ncbi:uncharacterized protein LOC106181240 [Lingula anatina]|uniref:Uncharacterized protein LOC106181240 n=1 Tax=Lingula anatina TaxID=7574 RepID=A0A1S3KEU0_LINAN|nr:uncharacterized protein LOC106181240 [Lingula anatina]|eukprot:XP_013421017.1 uncharacterized protein LOC106181240 [Lingula anatina]